MESSDREADGRHSLSRSRARQWGRWRDGDGVKPTQYERGLFLVAWAGGSLALKRDSVLEVSVRAGFVKEVRDGAEVELQACLSAPVSIVDAFCCRWWVVSLSEKLVLHWGKGELGVNEKLIEFGGQDDGWEEET
jgi:hypothetical protein